MENWKTIEPKIWNGKDEKEGDTISGVLIGKEPKDEIKETSARYFVENEGGIFLLWGSAVLDDRMNYVKVGDKIRITYKGKDKNKKGQPLKLYRVEVAMPGSGEDAQAKPAEEKGAVSEETVAGSETASQPETTVEAVNDSAAPAGPGQAAKEEAGAEI